MHKTKRQKLEEIYDMVRRELRLDPAIMEQSVYIKRNPVTDEISWPATTIEDDLRKMGLL